MENNFSELSQSISGIKFFLRIAIRFLLDVAPSKHDTAVELPNSIPFLWSFFVIQITIQHTPIGLDDVLLNWFQFTSQGELGLLWLMLQNQALLPAVTGLDSALQA